MPDTLQGLEIVLAGGSGGLGAAAVDLLAAGGARLTISYFSNAGRAQRFADKAAIVQADLVKAADRVRLLDSAPSLYGLVVFTGDPSRVKDPAELEAAMLRAYEVNCAGPIMLAREAAERMRAAGTPGSIVLFSTMQAVSLFPGSTAYAAAKASLQHAARILAKEMRAHNIRVNVIAPGATAAGMAEASIASGKYDRLLKEGLAPRFGKAIDVARAVRFFLEPDNYITGQVLSVDGGVTL
ncbi:MAG: SDR family oxidoreductase [Bryobacteraceae bacterium]|nr:SDR family oxidoreductase [Bryobacteraceae bacterium]